MKQVSTLIKVLGCLCVPFVLYGAASSVAGEKNKTAESSQDPHVEKILAIDADADYGEYLSGECVICHKAGEASGGVPIIHGLERAQIISALLEYKNGIRSNTTMLQVTKSLGDDEMAALAKYFAGQ